MKNISDDFIYQGANSYNEFMAEKYGLADSVLIHHFYYWIKHNASTGKNFIEGRTWSYQTAEKISRYLPFFTVPQVKRILKRLVEAKVLKKDKFSKNKNDHTLWYSFENEEMFDIERWRSIDSTKSYYLSESDSTKSYERSDEIVPSTYNNRCTKKRDIGGEPPTTPPPINSKPKKKSISKPKSDEEMISFGKKVNLPKKEYDELVAEHGKEYVNEMFYKIDDHMASTGAKYIDFAATFRVWNRRDFNKSSSGDNGWMSDMEYAKKVRQEFNAKTNNRNKATMECYSSYVEISGEYSPITTVINYTEKGFREQLDNAIRKWSGIT